MKTSKWNIIFISYQKVERFSTLSMMCKEKGYSYNNLRNKKYPFSWDGGKIYKVPSNKKCLNSEENEYM